MRKMLLPTALLATLVALPARAQDLAAFEKKVSVKTLANGLTVLVCERPEAPVFSFFTHVDVGGDREVPGITGLAHMFEHMAFKGTDRIGTTRLREREGGARGGRDRLRRLRHASGAGASGATTRRSPSSRRRGRTAIAEADRYVVPNEFGEIVEREGGVGLNAFTNSDETGYFFSFPANRLELWAYLESERFLKPGDARVLQGARRRLRGAAHADREPADRPADRAVPGGGLHRPSLRTARGGLALRPHDLLRQRRGRVPREATTSRRT